MNSNLVKKILIVLPYLVIAALVLFLLYQAQAKREAENQLTYKDAQLMKMNNELGLSESKLVKARELNKQLKEDKKGFDERLNKLIEEHNLLLKSKDITIAELRGKVKGGTTKVVVKEVPTQNEDGECKTAQEFEIAYEWKDPFGRFHLRDPSIWTEGDETFTNTQNFKLTGHIFEAKNGKLQTRKVELKEIDDEGNEIPGSNTGVKESEFTYTDRTGEDELPGLLDLVTLRPYALLDTSLSIGMGLELANLGKFVDWANVGIGVQAAANISDIPGGSLGNSTASVSAMYHFVPPLLATNLNVGVSVGVPFNDLGTPRLMLHVGFYLTEDLNPFTFWTNRPEVLGLKL